MQTIRRLLLVVCFAAVTRPLWAATAKDDFDFALGLMKREYYDLAEVQYRRIKETAGISAQERGEAALGLADLLLKAADAAPAGEKREEVLGRAAVELRQFLKSNPSHAQANSRRIRLGAVQLGRANIITAMFLNSDDKNTKATLRKKADPLFKDALASFEKAAEDIGRQFKSRSDKARTAKEKRKLEPLKAEMLQAQVQTSWAHYFRSKLYPDNASTRKSALTAGLNGFDKFAVAYRSYLITLSAKRGSGLCLHYLGRHKEAAKKLHDIVRTRPTSETEEIRQLAYHDKAAACVAGRMYDDAIRTSNAFFEEFEGIDSAVAQAILIEKGKAFAAQARSQKGLAARYAGQHKKMLQVAVHLAVASHYSKKYKKTRVEVTAAGHGLSDAQFGTILKDAKFPRVREAAKRSVALYELALTTAQQVSSKGGRWGRTAADLMARWMKESGQMPEKGAPETFASAEALFQEKKYLPAVSAYQETIMLASAAEAKMAAQSWFKMAYSYYNIRRYYESALTFGALAERHPKDSLAADSAYFAVQLYGGVYGQQPKKPNLNDGRRYLDALRTLGRNFPQHPEASKVQFMAAEMGRKNSDFLNAAQDYARVARSSEHYERAAYLSGLCYWLEFARRVEKNPKDKSLTQLWQKAESQLTGFVQWWDELPRIMPKRVPKGREWAARSRMRLAGIYVDPAVRQPQKALSVLGSFESKFKSQKALLPETAYLRMQAYAQGGRLPEAESQFKTLASRYSSFAQIGKACRILGVAYAEDADHKKKAKQAKAAQASSVKAAHYLALMVKKQPDLPLVDYTWAGTALYKLGKYKEGADVFSAAIKRFGKQDTQPVWDTRRRLGECYLALRDWPRALAIYERLVEREPRVLDYRREIARCYEENKDYDNALVNWRIVVGQATEESKEWYSAKYHLVFNHCKKGNYDRAYAILSLMLDLHPDLGGQTTRRRFDDLVKSSFPKDYQARFAQLKKSVAQGLEQ